MSADERVPIPGTHRAVWPGTTPAKEDLSLEDGVLLTAWLRPRRGGDLDVERAAALGATPPAQRTYEARAALAARTDADPGDVAALRAYCGRFGIEVAATHWRSVTLSAPIGTFVRAFGATAAIHEAPDKRRFRHRSESLHAPREIAAMLRGPFGIHQWPRSHAVGTVHGPTVPMEFAAIAQRYGFPDADGSGQTVGVLQLRAAFRPDDFSASMQSAGSGAQLPEVVRVDNAELSHERATEKDVESAMDTQIVGALAPGARVVVYAAPDDERGVLDGIRHAIFDEEHAPSVLSISFGFPEHLWTPVALEILDELFTAAALLGVSVFCASGDNGAELDYDGKPHVLAPASSAFAHACGGTAILPDGTERAWEKTGGGFSERFAVPPWQGVAAWAAAGNQMKAGRGVPDFAAQVRPGYPVFFEGTKSAMGGTSAVAPMWSALTARLNQRLGRPIGFFAPLLYDKSDGGLFAGITAGGNDRFQSGEGWNPCTGLGTPIGGAIERALRGTPA